MSKRNPQFVILEEGPVDKVPHPVIASDQGERGNLEPIAGSQLEIAAVADGTHGASFLAMAHNGFVNRPGSKACPPKVGPRCL